MRALLLVALLGCASSRQALDRTNLGLLATSTALLACDWGQTHSMAIRGWPANTAEENPMLGPSPSPEAVGLYFASAIVVNAAAWYLLPRRVKWVVAGPVTGFQARSVAGNHPNTPGYCGVWTGRKGYALEAQERWEAHKAGLVGP